MTTATKRIGMRFARSEAPALQELADRARARDLASDFQATFGLAAEAARTGEPLIVVCSNPLEAMLMAHGYSRFGITPPALEELSG